LFEVLWRCLQCPQDRAAIVYYKTPSIDPRLTLTDELVRAALPKAENGAQPHPDLKTWSAIYNEIKAQLATRRRIAHQPVRLGKETFSLAPDEHFGENEIELTYYEIHFSENEALRGKASEPLHINDLVDHDQAVTRLALLLQRFEKGALSNHAPKPPGR